MCISHGDVGWPVVYDYGISWSCLLVCLHLIHLSSLKATSRVSKFSQFLSKFIIF